MNWALFGLLVVTLAITLFWVFRLTVTVSRTSSNALASLISFDQRASQEREAHREQVRGLIDRILTGDVETVRGFETADEAEPGGFFTPMEQRESAQDTEDAIVELEHPRWGSASTTEGRLEALQQVEDLALDDDLDGFDADRERRLAQARERGVLP